MSATMCLCWLRIAPSPSRTKRKSEDSDDDEDDTVCQFDLPFPFPSFQPAASTASPFPFPPTATPLPARLPCYIYSFLLPRLTTRASIFNFSFLVYFLASIHFISNSCLTRANPVPFSPALPLVQTLTPELSFHSHLHLYRRLSPQCT